MAGGVGAGVGSDCFLAACSVRARFFRQAIADSAAASPAFGRQAAVGLAKARAVLRCSGVRRAYSPCARACAFGVR